MSIPNQIFLKYKPDIDTERNKNRNTNKTKSGLGFKEGPFKPSENARVRFVTCFFARIRGIKIVEGALNTVVTRSTVSGANKADASAVPELRRTLRRGFLINRLGFGCG